MGLGGEAMWATKRDLKRALARLHDAVIAEHEARVAMREVGLSKATQAIDWLEAAEALGRALVEARELAGKERAER